MDNLETVIEKIRQAFADNHYPGDPYLQGSREGCEPFDEVGPFVGKKDWAILDPDFLDSRAGALSFFSEAGFRYFLPAYLIADLRGQLKVAEPVFYLTSGFYDLQVEIQKKNRLFVIRSGKSAFINPLRYGAATLYDYARYRLSVFTSEESSAIVDYLRYKRDSEESGIERDRIDAALESFWIERTASAPSIEELKQHLIEKDQFLATAVDDKEI